MNWLLIFLVPFVEASSFVRILEVKDSINPGTADYIVGHLTIAENEQAPLVIIELDTPGGLLTSTRLIIQKMLNSTVPIVVYVGPKGAHAGSAGALITLAADVAAMAPGTNIGAAHPVIPGNEKIDPVMSEKMTNDTAAFAESIAKSKGRNQAWAIKAVRNSESIIAESALKEGIVDIIAEDRADLLTKLPSFRLRVAKQNRTTPLTSLPASLGEVRLFPPSITHRLVSFFADPNLAYMILSLGALCIWIELSSPGITFPGVLGAICIVLSLVSFQMMPIRYGALAFICLGMILVVLEIFVPAFGILGIGGIVSFILGSIYLMDSGFPEFQISMILILLNASVMTGVGFVLGLLVLRSRKQKAKSGVETLVGQFGEVKEDITARGGKVFVQGELWNAQSGLTIPQGKLVKITHVKGLALIVEPVN